MCSNKRMNYIKNTVYKDGILQPFMAQMEFDFVAAASRAEHGMPH